MVASVPQFLAANDALVRVIRVIRGSDFGCGLAAL